MSPSELDHLEAVAKRATSGFWRASRAARYVGPLGRPVAEMVQRSSAEADAIHIAAFSPETALRLIALARQALQ